MRIELRTSPFGRDIGRELPNELDWSTINGDGAALPVVDRPFPGIGIGGTGAAPRSERALVTGAAGFLGRHLVRALHDAGFSVRALVRDAAQRPADWPEQIETIVGDIRNASAVDAAVSGCHVVCHVAALYRDASAPRRAYWDVNVQGTQHILDACQRRQTARLVHCSTMGVHGSVREIPSDEHAPFAPGDEYQRTKLLAEQAVWRWHAMTQIPTSVIRPAGIYGPGDLRFLKLFQSIQRGYFVMLGSGRTWFHPVFIDDLVDAFLRCARKTAAVGEAFCISGERYVTLNDLVGLIAQVLGVRAPRRRVPVWPVYLAGALCEAVCVPLRIRPPLFRRRVQFFTHQRAFTSRKAERLLGYMPRVDLLDGLQRTAAWYQSQGHLRGNPSAGSEVYASSRGTA